MRFQHTHRPGFLFGLIDFCTAGLFFLFYMPLNGLQDELDEILGHRTQRYWVAYVRMEYLRSSVYGSCSCDRPLDGKVIAAIVFKHPEIFCFNERRMRLLM